MPTEHFQTSHTNTVSCVIMSAAIKQAADYGMRQVSYDQRLGQSFVLA